MRRRVGNAKADQGSSSARRTAAAAYRRTLALPRRLAANRKAIVAGTTVILPDARIDNLSGDRRSVRIGEHTYVRGHLLTFAHGGRISIGAWSYVGHRTEIWSAGSVEIGDRVLIAHDCNIVDTTSHSPDPSERHDQYRRMQASGHPTSPEDLPGVETAPIVIEDDAWISFGVTILRGVRIGRGAVIGAGSIVTQDVPPDHLYRMQVTPVITPLTKTR